MIPQPPQDKILVLFDGVCNLCNGTVQWLIRRDRHHRFLFASLQSEKAQQLLQRAPQPVPDSIIVYHNGRFYYQADAALAIATALGGAWKLMGGFRIVPRPIRNGVYGYIARHRYNWFGKREECMMPSPSLSTKFW